MIRSEMERRKLTIPDLAERTGYSPNVVGNWLRFVNVAKYTAVEDMLTALGFYLILAKEGEEVDV